MAKFNLNEMLAERPLRFGEASATGWDYFDYAPGQPNLFLLSRFKQLLVKEHGLEAGFELYRQRITKQKAASLKLRPLESHHAYAKAHALNFRESISAGRRFSILPPRIIGEGNHRPLRGVSRSFYVSCLEDAIVHGRSSIVQTTDAALADFQDDELARIDDEVEFDGTVFHRDGDKVWVIDTAQPSLEFDEALSLLGCRTDFFGDWLSDSIQRHVAATQDGQLAATTILIDAHMPRTHRQALELMFVGDPRIIEIEAFQPVRVRRLWWPPSLTYVPFHPVLNQRFKWDYLGCHSRDSVSIQNDMMRRADLVNAPTTGPTRVFLARKDFRHRKMVNRTEIEAIAASFGFAIVYPEDLEFANQARLLRRARYVIAPEGSALFLCAFMGSGAKLCILNHQQSEALTLYGGGAGPDHGKAIDLTIVTGSEAGERKGRSQDINYVIDPEIVYDLLVEWLGEQVPELARVAV
jgi:Glycosyltransferase 61